MLHAKARIVDEAMHGAEVVGGTPDEAKRFLQAEIARWGAVVKSAGLKAE
jgi:tripartite-type tricarboxylate transporter receptor subunit TctC